MCGIFGLIRSPEASDPDRASAAFVELGRLAVSRGRDAAGFALASGVSAPAHSAVFPAQVNSRDVTIDGFRVIKNVGSFDDLWDDDQHLPLLADARVALGHTRWATQGNRGDLTNASPLLTGDLIGTHNGDVAVASLPDEARLPRPVGSTDTERLYQALHKSRKDRRKMVQTLTAVEGRVALAWMDRGRGDRVYLARGALSPLSIAWDAQGNLYWASNPDWFRQIDTMFDGALGFHSITMVREGSLLSVELGASGPQIDDLREFTPQSRPSDERLGDGVVWRGFDPEDTAADKAQTRHTVAKARVKAPGKGKNTWSWSGSAGTSAASLPRYDQPLPSLGGTTYTSRLDSALAAEEPEWDEADLEMEITDEVDLAMTEWLDEDCNPALVTRLTPTPTPSEEAALIEELGFSCPEAFRRFREEILEWAEADLIEAEG